MNYTNSTDATASKNESQHLSYRPFLLVLLLAFGARALAAIYNVGFVAIDDYVYMLKLAFPAQQAPSFAKVIESSWVHPTLPMLALTQLARLPLWLGITDGLRQIQFVYLIIGVWSLFSVFFVYRIFTELGRIREGLIAATLVGLHFLMPFVSTRVLFESLSMPLLTASLYFFIRFQTTTERKYLFYSVAVIALSSLVRFQNGVCYFAFVLLMFNRQVSRGDRWFFMAASGIVFIASGLMDLLIERTFHQSILDYIRYNLAHSSEYGTSKWWNYLLLCTGLTLPPFLVRTWSHFAWWRNYTQLKPAIWFFLFFFISHSLIPHKEDRFMIPIFPIFLLLLAPLIHQLIQEKKLLRLYIFAAFNLFLMILASSFTSQWNTIGTARFLNDHKNYKQLLVFNQSLLFSPTAYMDNPELSVEFVDEHSTLPTPNCDLIYAVREDHLQNFHALNLEVQEKAVSHPGPLEWVIVQLNPKRNGRRAAIHLFTPAGCNS